MIKNLRKNKEIYFICEYVCIHTFSYDFLYKCKIIENRPSQNRDSEGSIPPSAKIVQILEFMKYGMVTGGLMDY